MSEETPMATQDPPQPPPQSPPPPAEARDARGEVSPDQLDRLLTLVRPQVWVVLAALLVLVGLAVVWGFVGTVSQKLPAAGIIQRGEGLRVVQAPVGGRVARLDAGHGATVRAGDTLARLEAPGGPATAVTAPIDGTVIDETVEPGAIVTAGERLFALEPSSGRLHATLAVPVDRRSELYRGEPVEVRLNGVDESELGYVDGEVASIDPYPASDGELRRIFGSDRLVDQITGGAAVYLVQVRLLTDPSTASGLAWSSRTGADVEVHAGQLADARIVVSQESLVDEVFP